jgi:polyvinyl alcohol dehydrogenase (cytochrome)
MHAMRAALFALTVSGLLASVPANAQDGSALYAQRCQSCHEGAAASRAPGRSVIAALPADRIVQALETGVMREQGQALSPAERRAIASFLSTTREVTASDPAPAACAASATPFRGAGAGDWNGWGLSLTNDRFQRQPGLTADQVPGLQLQWAFGFEGETSAATQPIVVGGRVFVGSGSGRIYSLDLQTGCTHWVFKADAGIRAAITIGTATAGAATAAYFGDQSGTVYSVDAATGALKWKQRVETHRAGRVTGSPVLYEGRLYVPLSSSEEANAGSPRYECCTFRGSLVALDAQGGAVLWKTYTIPEAPARTTMNSSGVQQWGPAGAAIWHAPTIDPVTRSVYVATGDAYTAPASPTTDAIMALDLETGAIKWTQQMTTGDAWNMSCGTAAPANCAGKAGPDFDFGQPPILVTLAGGRRALVIGQKSGTVHALDPDDRGRVLWSRPVAKGGMLGGFEWGSASDGQYFYAPASDVVFANPAVFARAGVDPSTGGGVFAVRIADGSVAWSAPPPPCTPPCSPAQPSPASLMPGVVFAGSVDGTLRAYSAIDGRIIWSFDTVRPFDTVNHVKAMGGSIDVGGPAIANGMVLTTSGYPTWSGKPGNVLLVFGVR